MTLTTVADLAAIVAQAVDFKGKWPSVGGIRGNRVTASKLLEIGKRVLGCSFTVDKVKIVDLNGWTLICFLGSQIGASFSFRGSRTGHAEDCFHWYSFK
ncbi:hypothetical protein ACJ73_07181 [Blastomyces percursus]|uniref:Uncharacterized protein n=1 Tax=Blastomyces percursus TaxID=1658174 RepID=A0A1J9QMQ9_9EURO|nr:hypothetical protein ACJ73_07181 [Blastomyces percursus]